MIGRQAPDGRARSAATEVVDPTTGLTLGELDLVLDATTRRGETTVRLALPADQGVQADLVRARVAERVRAVDPGVRQVDVDVTVMGAEQRASLGRTLRQRSRRPGSMGSTIAVYAVASGKGGVGKSTVSANLAVALAQQGKRVGVLDADVWGYSMPHLLGVREAPLALGGIMLPMPAHGTVLMSTGFFVADEEPVVWRGPMLHKALEQFLDDVFWGDLDALVVDLPPGTGDVSMSVIELLPSASMLVVTTPNAAAEQVAARVGRMARDARLPVVGVVENMSGSVCPSCGEVGATFGSGGGQRLAATLDVPLLGQVPLDPALATSGDDGTPLVLARPESLPARRLNAVAVDLPVVRPSLVGKSLPLFVGS